MKLHWLIGGLLLTAAPAAHGAVTVAIVDDGVPSNGTGTTLPGYRAFRFRLTTTNAGEVIQALNFGGTTGTTFSGITGPLLQRTSIDPDTGTRTPSPQRAELNGANVFSFDSHFLPPTRVDVAAPVEDNNNTNPPGSPADTATGDFGSGTSLTGTWGFLPAQQTQTLDVAYLVLPNNQAANYSAQVTTSSGTFNIAGAIPEPGSIGLLSAGGLLLLRRHRPRGAGRSA